MSVSKEPEAGAGERRTHCFHCGLPIPDAVDIKVTIDDAEHPMCCHGCQAVAQAIVDAGLARFYAHRTATSRRPEDLIPPQLKNLSVFDRPELQKSFVRSESEHIQEAALILEGIECAACAWLNERHVSAQPGVLEFRVNYSTHRAQLRWDNSITRLSEILGAIAAIGYTAHPFDVGRSEQLQKREHSVALRRLVIAGLGAMQVMMLAVALYAGDYYGMDLAMRDFIRGVSLLVTAIVVFASGRTFLSSAWRGLRSGHIGMDVPVSLAIVLALMASAWSTWIGGGEVYFDSVTMFIFFLLCGRFLEMRARHRATATSDELVKLLPATATRISGPSIEIVAVAELAEGDWVQVTPGETVPADGRVREGHSTVDESLLSGESLPRPRGPGEHVIGGSINIEGPLLIEIERVGQETVLSSIVRLLERAQGEKPRIAALADRVAGWFVAALLLIAALVAAWWWQHDPSRVFTVTLAVLVVTCPCALSLATPTALTVATGRLTRLGLLVTRGSALETLARVTRMVFDKTGTLTYGRLRLRRVVALADMSRMRCLSVAAALEDGSEHPLAAAIREAADEPLPRATQVRNSPGLGVEGVVAGVRYRVGTYAFVGDLSRRAESTRQSDASGAWLGDQSDLLARFEFSDQVRLDAADTVRGLRQLHVRPLLLSGDHPKIVNAVASELGIDEAVGGLLPEEKLQRVLALQNSGHVVAMVGDGINDAPVLAAAQVSVAMGSGTQLAHASADLILLSERLRALAEGVTVSRRTQAIIRQNLGWALAYNALALPLAASGTLKPWMAAIGMSLSSLLVTLNALRLRGPRSSHERDGRSSAALDDVQEPGN